jgi:hypothetical protein
MGSEWILGRLAGGGVDWIQLAQDRDWWLGAVNVVMNLWVLAPHSALHLLSPSPTFVCSVGYQPQLQASVLSSHCTGARANPSGSYFPVPSCATHILSCTTGYGEVASCATHFEI